MYRRIPALGAALLAVLFLLLPVGSAQTTSSNVTGTVVDASGATIPGVAVEVSNPATGVKFTSQTNQNGEYRVNNVPVGSYTITASAQGFTASSLRNVQLQLNQTATVNLTLQVGQVNTQVEVQEAAAVIDTTTAQVQNTFDPKQLIELPQANAGLNGVLNLSLLGAGVTSGGGVGYGTGPSIGGQRPTNNNFNIEGVDNNDRSVTGPVVYVPNEAVSQFTVLQNQYNPEFGGSSGGIFNTVIKSGTNDLHGVVYDYLQNRNLNAVDQSNARQDILTNPRFDQNRLGASIGGPVIKNKLFYFGNFEYTPTGQSAVPAGAVYAPTAAGYTALANLPGVSKNNLSVLQQYLPASTGATGPTLTVSGLAIPTSIIPISGPNFNNRYALTTGGDWTASERDQVRLRYIYNKIDTIDTSAGLPVFYSSVQQRTHLVSFSEFHNFSPFVTNELRLAYNRKDQAFPVGDQTFPGLNVFPNISVDPLNVNIGPGPNFPQSAIQNTYQLVDNLSWTRGKHTFKFGYDGRKLIAPSFFVQRSRGDYEYSSLERYLLDQSPDVLGERSAGGYPYAGDLISHYAYVNDDFKLRPNLTINLGARYEFVDVPFGSKLQRLNSLASLPGVLDFNEPTSQKNNWAPRVGFAYSPSTNGTTSIRGGFSMAYDQIYQNLGTLALPPQFSSTNNVDLNTATANFLGSGALSGASAGSNLTAAQARGKTSAYVPDQKRPYSINWNLGIQHVFAKDYTAEVRYLGTRGVHLPVQVQLNAVSPVTPTNSLPTYFQAPAAASLSNLGLSLGDLKRINPLAQYGFTSNITSFQPIGNSTYHGLATQLTKRYSANLYFLAAYTWSHAIDDSTAAVFSTYVTPRRPQDFRNLANDRSSSALDRRHRFTYTAVYDLPFFKARNLLIRNTLGNWNIGGTYTFESPEYATVQSGIDSNLNGDSAGDRALVNPNGQGNTGSGVYAVNRQGATVPSGDPTTVAYVAINPNAKYVQAGSGTFPNAGRNTLPLRRINNIDLNLQKRFSLTERYRFDIGAQFFNLFNHPQAIPGPLFDVGPQQGLTNSRNFLLPQNALFNQSEQFFSSNPRTVQVLARFTF